MLWVVFPYRIVLWPPIHAKTILLMDSPPSYPLPPRSAPKDFSAELVGHIIQVDGMSELSFDAFKELDEELFCEGTEDVDDGVL